MHSILYGFIGAGKLILTINPELLSIILLSLQVSGSALVLSLIHI